MKFHSMAAAAVLTVSAFGAQAVETYSTGFGAAASTSQTLSAAAIGTFAAGAFVNGNTTDSTIVLGAAGDAIARMNLGSYLTLSFNLLAPASQITASFFASSSNGTSAGTANVSIDNGTVQSQAITALNVVNPGPTGTFISRIFTGSFAAGLHTLRIDNEPTSGFRVDDVSVTAVPEPGTYAMLLAGLAAVGFVAKRRSA